LGGVANLTFREAGVNKLSYEGRGENIAREFYIPILSQAVRYDRATGYFSVASLVHAASGVAGFTKNQGKMRLILGAHDVPRELWEAYKSGTRAGNEIIEELGKKIAEGMENVEDVLTRNRLEAIAWMFHEGYLQVKVVLPRHILPTDAGIFHYKTLVFQDKAGEYISAEGSANETEPAFTINGERLVVFYSWREGDKERIDDAIRSFERIWEDRQPDFECFELPEAVRRSIIKWTPKHRPERDPEEKLRELEARAYGLLPAARLVKLLPKVKCLAHMGLGPVRLYPHQVRAVNLARSHYPFRVLFADEVGLGKTVEAGATLKLLSMTGYVRRVLVLAPKNIMKQWWDELRLKFNMPFYLLQSGKPPTIVSHDGKETQVLGNPYDEVDMLVASWHYARGRRGVESDVLKARPFDMVIIDEAHAARVTRPTFGTPKATRLNELATALSALSPHVFLVTATPQQLNELEVLDLLKILGLGGPWVHEEDFTRFYNELKTEPNSRIAPQWLHMLRLITWFAKTYLYEGDVEKIVKGTLSVRPPLASNLLRALTLGSEVGFQNLLKGLAEEDLDPLDEVLRGLSPLSWFMIRHNRHMLEEIGYRFPKRIQIIQDVQLDEAQRLMLEDLERYLHNEYNAYRAFATGSVQAGGFGLIRSVYYQRFVSSFAAAYHTVKKRREFLSALLEGDQEQLLILAEKMLEEADIEDYDENDLVNMMRPIVDKARNLIIKERDKLAEFERKLGQYSLAVSAGNDPKIRKLRQVVSELRAEGRKILIFSKFTDTVDIVRDFLALQIGPQKIGTYTGRGGEIWNGESWAMCDKEDVRRAIDNQVEILVCSDAASEGLNLQAASAVINMDMPWNPAKVEQRIGRVDRIGQTSPDVKVVNIWYPDTYEARIYSVLIKRFGGILNVLGPILDIVESSIAAALAEGMKSSEFAKRLQEIIKDIEASKDEMIRERQILTAQVKLEPTPDEQLIVNLLRDFVVKVCGALGMPVRVTDKILLVESAEKLPFLLQPYIKEGVALEIGRPNALVPGHPLVQWLADQVQTIAKNPSTVSMSAYGISTREGLMDVYVIRPGDRMRRLSEPAEVASLLKETIGMSP
jgi:superfamily II DNA or RNA helicase